MGFVEVFFLGGKLDEEEKVMVPMDQKIGARGAEALSWVNEDSFLFGVKFGNFQLYFY